MRSHPIRSENTIRTIRPRVPYLSLTFGALILATALHGTPLQAKEKKEAAQAGATSTSPAEISWMSGGVGDEALGEMRKVASSYNVHIVFSDRAGAYLAGIPFTVAGGDGHIMHSGVSDGPLLYLKLKPGSYRISAEIDGAWQRHSLKLGANGPSVRMSFVSAAK